jgi:DNA replication protein DnaC
MRLLKELRATDREAYAAALLYNVVSRLHERSSIVITTNLAFKQWGTVFPGAACVVALVDRLPQHHHEIDIDADSWRDAHDLERDHDPDCTRPRRRPGKRR